MIVNLKPMKSYYWAVLFLVSFCVGSCSSSDETEDPTPTNPNNPSNSSNAVIFATDNASNTDGNTIKVVGNDEVTNITNSSATVSNQFTQLNSDEAIIDYGFAWAKHDNPKITDTKKGFGNISNPTSYSFTITDLEPETNYWVVSFVQISSGTYYLTPQKFKTLSTAPPSVKTNSVLEVTDKSAAMQGELIESGDGTVTEFGFVYSTNEIPTINDGKASVLGNKLGKFTVTAENLSPSTKYYCRAYAISSEGVGYGVITDFTTRAEITERWEEVTAYPLNIFFPHRFILQNKVYVFGGLKELQGDMRNRNMYVYDPTNDIWSPTNAELPFTDKVPSCGFSINGVGYMSDERDLYRYNQNLDKWEIDNAGWGMEGDYRSANLHIFNINNIVYILNSDNELWAFDGTDWEQKKDFPGVVLESRNGALFSAEGKGYALFYGFENNQFYNDMWSYHPDENQWFPLKDFPIEKSLGVDAFVINNRPFILARATTGVEFQEYIIKDDRFELRKSLYETSTKDVEYWLSQEGSLVFSVGGRGYIGSGIVVSSSFYRFMDDLWRYTP